MNTQYESLERIETIVQGFETCSLSKADFTHRVPCGGQMRTLAALMVLPMCLVALVGCTDVETLNPKPEDPAQLAPPSAGQGFQFESEDFAVPVGVEEQDCYFFKVRDLAAQGGLNPDEPVNLHRVQIAYKPGSHHMNIFRVRTILDLNPANGPIQRSLNGQAPCSKNLRRWGEVKKGCVFWCSAMSSSCSAVGSTVFWA